MCSYPPKSPSAMAMHTSSNRSSPRSQPPYTARRARSKAGPSKPSRAICATVSLTRAHTASGSLLSPPSTAMAIGPQ